LPHTKPITTGAYKTTNNVQNKPRNFERSDRLAKEVFHVEAKKNAKEKRKLTQPKELLAIQAPSGKSLGANDETW
jgi:hypothetical protein